MFTMRIPSDILQILVDGEVALESNITTFAPFNYLTTVEYPWEIVDPKTSFDFSFSDQWLALGCWEHNDILFYTWALSGWELAQWHGVDAGASEFAISTCILEDRAFFGLRDLHNASAPSSLLAFQLADGRWGLAGQIDDPSGDPDSLFGGQLLLAPRTLFVSAAGLAAAAYEGAGAVFVFDADGTDVTLSQNLTSPQAAEAEHFGALLAHSEDTLVVGSYSNRTYVFERGGDGAWAHAATIETAVAPNSIACSSAYVFMGLASQRTVQVYRRGDAGWALSSAIENTAEIGFGKNIAYSTGILLVASSHSAHSLSGGAVVVLSEPDEEQNGWTEIRRISGRELVLHLGTSMEASPTLLMVGSLYGGALVTLSNGIDSIQRAEANIVTYCDDGPSRVSVRLLNFDGVPVRSEYSIQAAVEGTVGQGSDYEGGHGRYLIDIALPATLPTTVSLAVKYMSATVVSDSFSFDTLLEDVPRLSLSTSSFTIGSGAAVEVELINASAEDAEISACAADSNDTVLLECSDAQTCSFVPNFLTANAETEIWFFQDAAAVPFFKTSMNATFGAVNAVEQLGTEPAEVQLSTPEFTLFFFLLNDFATQTTDGRNVSVACCNNAPRDARFNANSGSYSVDLSTSWNFHGHLTLYVDSNEFLLQLIDYPTSLTWIDWVLMASGVLFLALVFGLTAVALSRKRKRAFLTTFDPEEQSLHKIVVSSFDSRRDSFRFRLSSESSELPLSPSGPDGAPAPPHRGSARRWAPDARADPLTALLLCNYSDSDSRELSLTPSLELS